MIALRLVLAVLILPALLVGCSGGDKTGTITGKVISKTKPLAGGTITFQVKDKPETALTFPIGDDGTYTAENIPYGELQISIVGKDLGTSTLATMSSAKAEMGRLDSAGQNVPQSVINAASGGVVPGNSPPPANAMNLVDPKFADPLTSELTFTLDSRTAEKNFDLP